MTRSVSILSSDAVFARMLELDFLMRGTRVLRAEQPRTDLQAEVVLLDLDTCPVPAADTYRRLIGFTRNSLLLTDDVRRQCSMILHRPFEMSLLRREVFSGEGAAMQEVQSSSYATQAPQELELVLQDDRLIVEGQPFALTPTEAQVIGLLLERRGTAVSREEISERIGASSANKVDVYVCYLRKKLEGALHFKLIHTQRGCGYFIR